jgi:hypothetical protein
MISSGLNSGKDEPFAYDHAAGAFLTVTGITNGNSPTTQALSGAWTPPTMANVGVYVLVTHPGFPGGATKFGYFDITTAGAPVWAAGDTATNALPSVPVAVQNFANRAYFACANTTPYTDVLDPLTRTNSTQALTIGDTTNVTALSGLPIQTTSSGMVQALLVFKAFQLWQVTGDAASSTLALNYLSLTVGTSSPRSIAQSTYGTYFASNSGPRVVDQLGIIRGVTKSLQEDAPGVPPVPDIIAPWQNATTPSRIAAGYAGNIYRICMETTLLGSTATNDYWFDENRRRWNGPHTFSYDCTSRYGNYMVLASNASPGKLFKSEIVPSANSVYTDDGAAFSCTQKSATFPKARPMAVKMAVESTVELASAGGAASYQITALDDQGNTLNSCQVSIAPAGGLWGSVVWGAFMWASATNIPKAYTVPWTEVLVFTKMAILVTATASTALAFGTFFIRWQDAGYLNTP